jgi:PPOX class probable F420-dependent enzyme
VVRRIQDALEPPKDDDRVKGKLNPVNFSTAQEMAIRIEPHVVEFINSHRVARLATADSAGHPAVVPICYVFDGAAFYSIIDQKPKRVDHMELQRIRNIRANPNVALVIDDYSENWGDLIYVIVRGTAEILERGQCVSSEHEAVVAAMRSKYEQYRSMMIDGNPIIKIVPTKVRSWSSGPEEL